VVETDLTFTTDTGETTSTSGPNKPRPADR
jgi:hypothetical protein